MSSAQVLPASVVPSPVMTLTTQNPQVLQWEIIRLRAMHRRYKAKFTQLYNYEQRIASQKLQLVSSRARPMLFYFAAPESAECQKLERQCYEICYRLQLAKVLLAQLSQAQAKVIDY